MADITDQFGFPAVIVPKPFVLAEQDSHDLKKIRDEVMDKVKTWENSLKGFFDEYNTYAQDWRVRPISPSSSKPRGLANSKSGETHRATETLATAWFRMLTSSDQFFMATGRGVDPFGRELSEEDIYTVEAVIMQQLQKTQFKAELLKSLTSCALFGTVIFEEPWVRRLNLDGQTYFEGTGFQLCPLIKTGFDTTALNIDMSDYIFTVDYPSIWRLKSWANQDPDTWDRSKVYGITQTEEYSTAANTPKTDTQVLNRMIERRQRAGYAWTDNNIREIVSYHGKLDTNNSVIQRYWESAGRKEDPSEYDFSPAVLDGDNVVKFCVTQYGTWRSKFKTAHFKSFELEPLGYGTGSIGRRTQKELDSSFSRMSDVLTFSLYSMWKVGRFAGLKANQLSIKPWNIVELEDISQLEPLRPDLNAIGQALAVQGVLREEIRANTGATANLQAIQTKATATESTLTQAEAIRGASVHAEIIAETMVRDHVEQMHINNLDFLDEALWVSMSGTYHPRFVNRSNLPRNVGFQIKVTTDKDFRPERIQKLLEGLQMVTSIRNVVPNAINAAVPMFEEYFRDLGMNPRDLKRPMSVADQLIDTLRRNQASGKAPQLANETAGEVAGAQAGSGANVSTPMGDVPTSPLPDLSTL